MDWELAIERHRVPLLRIVATLFALIGLSDRGPIERLPRPLHRAVLFVLRPAEAAVRRLIMVAARDLVAKPSPRRPLPPGLVISGKSGRGEGRPSFQLFDPRLRFDDGHGFRHHGSRPQPRIGFIDVAFDPRIPLFRAPPPASAGPEEEDAGAEQTVNAAPLCRRLAAIRFALEDLSRQARRLARWRARPLEARRPRFASPLRVGRPPGLRKRQSHEVDDILAECHWLARHVPAPDSS